MMKLIIKDFLMFFGHQRPVKFKYFLMRLGTCSCGY